MSAVTPAVMPRVRPAASARQVELASNLDSVDVARLLRDVHADVDRLSNAQVNRLSAVVLRADRTSRFLLPLALRLLKQPSVADRRDGLFHYWMEQAIASVQAQAQHEPILSDDEKVVVELLARTANQAINEAGRQKVMANGRRHTSALTVVRPASTEATQLEARRRQVRRTVSHTGDQRVLAHLCRTKPAATVAALYRVLTHPFDGTSFALLRQALVAFNTAVEAVQ